MIKSQFKCSFALFLRKRKEHYNQAFYVVFLQIKASAFEYFASILCLSAILSISEGSVFSRLFRDHNSCRCFCV